MRSPLYRQIILATGLSVSVAAHSAGFSTVGDSVSVLYTGNAPGLSAQSVYTLTAIENAGTTWVFSGTLENTSSVSSRISIAGFNTSGLVDLTGSSASGGFDRVSAGAMPKGDSVDICFKNSGGANCAGGGGTGVWNTDNPLQFSFTIQLSNALSVLDLGDYAVRFQSAPCPGNMAYVAYEQFAPSPVPLPAAGWLMFSAITGLGAAKLRNRKRT
ncbi:cistern family PEP-CTERM protein [Haliea sp. E17]|uniref:cistern family PEP-CTERM protein n=1 Tax=Haliea sp. E17 TaxID=3401576 RepID=UPI003AAC7BF5